MSANFQLEPGLSETEVAIVETAHRYARDVARPAGIVMDRSEPDAILSKDSPYWGAFAKFKELGLNLREASEGLSIKDAVRLKFLVHEELGWGDLGLGWSFYAATFPAALAEGFGRADLMEIFTYDQVGCWGITEPNHGSDMLDFTHSLSSPELGGVKSNCVVVKRGAKLFINGQKSAWVSNGSVATTMSLFCRYDDGSGRPNRGAFLVPLDLPGVKKSEPMRKLGVRSLTDSEIYFDNVELPLSHLVCEGEVYTQTLAGVLINANPGMAVFIVGLARHAFELALQYAKERVQGGRPIFEYQAVKLKLFEMYRKISAARALARHVMMVHADNPAPRFELAATAKVTGTQMALEVTNAAFEIFGGNAQTTEYPIEKLLRDARLGTIADGTNDVLSLMAASRL
jgi:alkylation response protein AidB-like acyl-CoA dehydrogenase